MSYPTTAELSHSIYNTPVHVKHVGMQSALDTHGGHAVLRKVAPDMSKEQHASLATAHRKAADVHDAAWSKAVDKAHKKTFGKEYRPLHDYHVSGVANYEYDEKDKDVLRHHAHSASKHRQLAHAHARLAGAAMKEDVETRDDSVMAKSGDSKLASAAIGAADVARRVSAVAVVAERLAALHGAIDSVVSGDRDLTLTLRCYDPPTGVISDLAFDRYGKLMAVAALSKEGLLGETHVTDDVRRGAEHEITVSMFARAPLAEGVEVTSIAIMETVDAHLLHAGIVAEAYTDLKKAKDVAQALADQHGVPHHVYLGPKDALNGKQGYAVTGKASDFTAKTHLHTLTPTKKK